MQIAGDQAALMTILVGAIGASRALEVGTFLGYGAIAIARGLPPDGTLVCCELSEEYAERARGNLEQAGVADRVEFRIGPALETLRELPASEPFDFSFIDADKVNYAAYYELALGLTRPGGLIALDNMLYEGEVIDPDPGERAAAIAELNDAIAADARVRVAMLGMADGITLVQKL